jgi:pentatricopeptide repeat protein
VGASRSLSEELAHLADLFAPTGGGPDGDSTELGPSSIATLTLAEIYSRQGLYEKAAEVCERMLESDPDNEGALSALEDYKGRLAAAEAETG